MGDELGQIKRIDVATGVVRTINKHLIPDLPAPDKPVLSIRGFREPCFRTWKDVEDEEEDTCMDGKARAAITNADPDVLMLVTQKPNQVFVYNSVTEKFIPIPIQSLCNHSPLVGAAPVDRNNVVVCFENGNIFLVNIEKELVRDYGSDACKASKVLGLDSNLEDELKKRNELIVPESEKRMSPSDATHHDDGKKKSEEMIFRPNPAFEHNPVTQIFHPNWKRDKCQVTCFEVSHNRLAIAGRNIDLKVFDLKTHECIFTAKGKKKKWLSHKSHSDVGDMAWIGPITSPESAPVSFASKVRPSPVPCLVATCSKLDALIRIYDIRSKRRKAMWILNFKDERPKSEPMPPSFTCITASPSPVTCAVPTQQLILGTTMGRMLATELRFNSHCHRQLGVFKGFSGGTVRGISFVSNAGKMTCHRVVSCSSDRFVRIHTFRTGSDPKRKVESKFYIKTRPTCVQPILGNAIFMDSSFISDYNDLIILDEYMSHFGKGSHSIRSENQTECASGINVADFDEV